MALDIFFFLELMVFAVIEFREMMTVFEIRYKRTERRPGPVERDLMGSKV
jgi:hypothetical protein